MNNKKWVVLRVIIITLIPSILTLLAKSNSIMDIWQAKGILPFAKDNIPYIKDVLLIIAIVFSSIFLSIRLALVEIEKNNILKQRVCLIRYNKDNFLDVLQNKGLIEHTNVNIRLFVPRKGILTTIKILLNKVLLNKVKFTREFIVKNVEGLGNRGKTDNLSFIVYPENRVQGLVGECYNRKMIVYDDDLCDQDQGYRLTKYQIEKTFDIKFWLCVPLFNKKGEVVSIITFDSTMEIKINKEDKQDWRMAVTNYCQYFNECFLDLFK